MEWEDNGLSWRYPSPHQNHTPETRLEGQGCSSALWEIRVSCEGISEEKEQARSLYHPFPCCVVISPKSALLS